jgi:hypothetical protein
MKNVTSSHKPPASEENVLKRIQSSEKKFKYDTDKKRLSTERV